jgi:3-deoxy-D-manno-octulosonic-acid transferase
MPWGRLRSKLSWHVYATLMRLLLPVVLLRICFKSRNQPLYREGLSQRWGRYAPVFTPPTQEWVWIHAVSLGETRVAGLLMQAWRKIHPDICFLLTHTTATGHQAGQCLLGINDRQAWWVWDTPGAVRRFLAHWRPQLGVLIETEVWPGLSRACQQQRIPLVLVNARLSTPSLQWAQRWYSLMAPAYTRLEGVWAQTQADSMRLKKLGAPVMAVTGNMKFDALPSPTQLAQGHAWRAQDRRPVVMLASSREGEEELFLHHLALLYKHHRNTFDTARWLIVPRHPQRFEAVARLITNHGFSAHRRSQWEKAAPPTYSSHVAQIELGDSLGEMTLYYAWAQLALLGGSFEPYGGQNLIEALACQCPVIMGPHTFHFDEAAQRALAKGCVLRVHDMEQAIQQALALIENKTQYTGMAQRASGFIASQQGACQQTVLALQALL